MASPAMYPRRRRSLAGPVVLIAIGLLFLLRNLGVNIPLFHLFAIGWPALLILVGAIKLGEYYSAKREGEYAPGVTGGTVVLIVFLIIFGLGVTAAYRAKEEINWGKVRDEFQMDDDVMAMFGHKAYTYDQDVAKEVPAGTSVKVISDRGSIAITSTDDNTIKVVAHKRIYASSDQAAQEINNNTSPQIEISGQTATINVNTQGAGPKGVVTDVEISVPRKLALEVSAHRGDINISGRSAEIRLDAGRGDVGLDEITGNINATMNHGSLHASKVTGNIGVEGRVEDLVAIDVTGSVNVNGDVFGDLKLSKVSKGVVFHSSRTDFELAKLDGDLDMDRSDLRADNVIGPTTMNVRTKDVQLESVTGELKVQGETGDVAVQFADKQPMGNVTVTMNRGSVRLTLPSKAGFQLDASTRNGNVNSDYSELTGSQSDHGNASTKGIVGKGNSKIVVSTDVGDIDIRKATT